MSRHDTDIPPLFAFHADAVPAHIRLPVMKMRQQDFDQLHFIDRTTAQLKINAHMVGDRRRFIEGINIRRICVNNGDKLFHILEVAEGLNTPGRGAGPDRD